MSRRGKERKRKEDTECTSRRTASIPLNGRGDSTPGAPLLRLPREIFAFSLSLSCSACAVASHVGGVRQRRPPFTPSDWPRWELSSCASRADGMTPNEINGRLMGNGGSRHRRKEARLLWLDTCAALAREAGRTRRCSVSCRRMTLRYFLRRSSQTRERAFYVLACFCVLK